jgi:hypothetical protein
MSRARRAHSSPVQLFPFLAVLVSALGALVLLLIAINRQVALQAVAAAARALAEQTNGVEDSLNRQRGELEHDIGALRREIGDTRSRVAAVGRSVESRKNAVRSSEIRSTELEGKLADLRAHRAEVAERVSSIRQEIEALHESKARAASEAPDPDRTFVPVVHPGVNGTTRRPIYLECTDRGVIVQPDQVLIPSWVLELEEGRATLSQAVRALSEYFVVRDARNRSGKSKTESEPYPLLLVRPSGVVMYYAARQALEGLEVPFGYELIERDWTLQFPPSDPAARGVLAAALATKPTATAAANPLDPAGRRLTGAAGRGGGVGNGTPNSPGSLPQAQAAPWWDFAQLDGVAAASGPGSPHGSADALGNSGAGGRPGRAAGGEGTGDSTGRGRGGAGQGSDEYGSTRSPGRTNASGRLGLAPNLGRVLGLEPESNQPHQIEAAAADADGMAEARSPAGSASQPMGAPGNRQQSNLEKPTQDSTSSENSPPDIRLELTPVDEERTPDERELGPARRVMPPGVRSARAPAREARDLSADVPSWAFATSNGKVPVSRTIEIDCWAANLAVRGRGKNVRVSSPARMSQAFTTLMHELDLEVAAWGPAGMTYYWQPRVLCLVHPGGLEMYYRLRELLTGSPVELEHVILAENEFDFDESMFLHAVERFPNRVDRYLE